MEKNERQKLLASISEDILNMFDDAFEQIKDLDDIFSDINEKELEHEFEEMLIFMSSKIQGIEAVRFKSLLINDFDRVVDITFAFKAINIDFKDNRCYTIRTRY